MFVDILGIYGYRAASPHLHHSKAHVCDDDGRVRLFHTMPLNVCLAPLVTWVIVAGSQDRRRLTLSWQVGDENLSDGCAMAVL